MFDELVHEFERLITNPDIIWRETQFTNLQYYYAEECLYVLRTNRNGHYEYAFVRAGNWLEAADKFIRERNYEVVKK